MNGLSLEFEGSRGQNEPGIFLGDHACLTIHVGKGIGRGIPRPAGMVNITSLASLGILYDDIRMISEGLGVFGGVLDHSQEFSAQSILSFSHVGKHAFWTNLIKETAR